MATPPRKTAKDFDPEVLSLFDQYVHGAINRRDFLKRAAHFAVGATTAAGLLAALSPQFAAAQQVSPKDVRLTANHMTFESPHGYGQTRGYLAKPAKAGGSLPVVLVVHENRGLNPHIEDITRRPGACRALVVESRIRLRADRVSPVRRSIVVLWTKNWRKYELRRRIRRPASQSPTGSQLSPISSPSPPTHYSPSAATPATRTLHVRCSQNSTRQNAGRISLPPRACCAASRAVTDEWARSGSAMAAAS